MARVTSLTLAEDFYVGDERFIATEVFGETHFRARRDRTGRSFEITPDRQTEILEEVFAGGGKRRKPPRINVAIDAPLGQASGASQPHAARGLRA